MNSSIIIQIATILVPIITAALTGGGIVAYFNYRAGRPESDAKANQLNVTSEISVADAWQKYAQQVEKRFTELEAKYDKAINLKDKQIEILVQQVNDLKSALSKYESADASQARINQVEIIKKSADALITPIPPSMSE